MKFTSEGEVGCFIEVVPDLSFDAPCTLRIVISDTGIGMDSDTMEHLFEPFTQAENAEERSHGGTGLGMTFVKQIVDKLGGEISVSSKLGEGTTVEIKLPTEEYIQEDWVVTQAGSEEETDTTTLETVDDAALEGLQVLVADDNQQNRFILARVLESWGCDLVMAECGQSAFDIAKQHSFDAIILDLHMPKKSGFEVAECIRQYTSSTWLIACSADTTQVAYAKCQEAGFDDILAKPFDWEMIFQSLSKAKNSGNQDHLELAG
jgi:CheY-like chemotaxis protein